MASLNELEVPSSPREIADYASARFGRTVDYRAFASIRRDERRAFDSTRSNRAVYIVPAIRGTLATAGARGASRCQSGRSSSG